jgi:hypothetical protein
MSMTSCSDEQQQTERQIRALLSWSATADMILNAQAQMLIPAGFSTLAIDRCKNEISSLSKKLAEKSPQDLTVTIGKLNEIIDAANDEFANNRGDETSQPRPWFSSEPAAGAGDDDDPVGNVLSHDEILSCSG